MPVTILDNSIIYSEKKPRKNFRIFHKSKYLPRYKKITGYVRTVNMVEGGPRNNLYMHTNVEQKDPEITYIHI